jgi:hypothetical protein
MASTGWIATGVAISNSCASSKCGKSTAAWWGVVATKKITTKTGACRFLAALAARVHTTC